MKRPEQLRLTQGVLSQSRGVNAPSAGRWKLFLTFSQPPAGRELSYPVCPLSAQPRLAASLPAMLLHRTGKAVLNGRHWAHCGPAILGRKRNVRFQNGRGRKSTSASKIVPTALQKKRMLGGGRYDRTRIGAFEPRLMPTRGIRAHWLGVDWKGFPDHLPPVI